jgi:hypothetical protein
MTRRLRGGSSRNGLILANGGVLSYQHAICLSSLPPRNGSPYPNGNGLEHVEPDPIPPVDFEVEGPATIEVSGIGSPSPAGSEITCGEMLTCGQTYTVEFNRDGTPLRAYIVGRLTDNNHRFLANEGDQSTLLRLSSSNEEPIGKLGTVIAGPLGKMGQRKNLFFLDTTARL